MSLGQAGVSGSDDAWHTFDGARKHTTGEAPRRRKVKPARRRTDIEGGIYRDTEQMAGPSIIQEQPGRSYRLKKTA